MITHKRTYSIASSIFVGLIAVYWFSALALGRDTSPQDTYFNLLADSFLHGRLFLVDVSIYDDLTAYAGQWYVPFPPLPALLLIPFVGFFGVAQVNTVLFGACIGAVNAALTFLLLDALSMRGWSQLRTQDNLWLTLLFSLGSVHWYMSTLGTVWFLAQICTATFMLMALWLAVRSRIPGLPAIALAIAMLGRPHVALLFPLILGIEIQHQGEQRRPWQHWLRWGITNISPLIISVAVLLSYNAARFGNPWDFGYMRQNISPMLAGDLQTYGQFNLYYLAHNFWAMLLAGPVWDAEEHMFFPSIEGMSLLLTTPALALLGLARRPRPLVIGAWTAIGLILVPLLTYYNTGWWQFGYRFSLDFMPAAMLLLALAAGPRLSWGWRGLIILGVIVNAAGTWWFANPNYAPW